MITKHKHVPVASHGLLRPKAVAEAVEKRTQWRFDTNLHARAWKHFRIRPPSNGSSDVRVTDARYCSWDELLPGYGYTGAWVDLLCRELRDEKRFEEIIGKAPTTVLPQA